jgi:hypothetical protein
MSDNWNNNRLKRGDILTSEELKELGFQHTGRYYGNSEIHQNPEFTILLDKMVKEEEEEVRKKIFLIYSNLKN